MAESHGKREFIGGGELVPHPETAAQTRGKVCEHWRCGDFAMSELHGTREFIVGGGRVRRLRRKPMGGANHVRQAYEYWQRGGFAMAESHGTREFIGGGELVLHPETAAQTWAAPTV